MAGGDMVQDMKGKIQGKFKIMKNKGQNIGNTNLNTLFPIIISIISHY